jgi:hypothetical protein
MKQIEDAVRRLRAMAGGPGKLVEVYGNEVDMPGQELTAWMCDRAVLADAYLAEHPADDDEPVTEEWLRAVGFVTHRQGVAIDMGLRSRGGPWLYFACCPGLVNPDWMFDDGRLLAAPDLNTRGHVRRLCEALGVPLRAGEGE